MFTPFPAGTPAAQGFAHAAETWANETPERITAAAGFGAPYARTEQDHGYIVGMFMLAAAKIGGVPA